MTLKHAWGLALLVLVSGCAPLLPQSDGPVSGNSGLGVPDQPESLALKAGMPEGVYRDPDPVARASRLGDLSARALRLRRILAADPGNVPAHVELAYLYSLQGNGIAMEGHYTRAKRIAGAKSDFVSLRRITWSEGWSRLNIGDHRGALRVWKVCAGLHGGAPFWKPYSYAVLLWAAGERDAALHWYRAAVASDRAGWETEQGMLRKTAHWRTSERTAMQELFAAYAAAAR